MPRPLADREPAPEPPAPNPPAEPIFPSEGAAAAMPPSDRRTIQIGERPGPPAPAPPVSPVQDRGSGSFLGAWGPRLAAALALAIFLAIVVAVLLPAVF